MHHFACILHPPVWNKWMLLPMPLQLVKISYCYFHSTSKHVLIGHLTFCNCGIWYDHSRCCSQCLGNAQENIRNQGQFHWLQQFLLHLSPSTYLWDSWDSRQTRYQPCSRELWYTGAEVVMSLLLKYIFLTTFFQLVLAWLGLGIFNKMDITEGGLL